MRPVRSFVATSLVVLSNAGFWLHYLFYTKNLLPAALHSEFLRHFILWFILLLVLTWTEAFLLGFALARERRSSVLVGIALWLSQFGTLGFMLWAIDGA